MHRTPLVPLAYGYVRFSSDAQERGDSVRRQRDAILVWLKRRKGDVQLDLSLGEGGFFIDQGKTGFAATGDWRGKGADWEERLKGYELGTFFRHCRTGRVRPGSVLVVESADRLSRESPMVALNLFSSLVLMGVVVVTLVPEQEYRSDADFGKLITAGVTIDRAHDESRVKRNRGTNAWTAKRAGAAERPMTSLIPGWCRLVGERRGPGNRFVGGKIKPDPAKVATVRRIFALCLEGKGVVAIARELNEKAVPVVGRAKKWSESSVHHILTSPAVIGEYHPHTGTPGNSKKGKANTRKPTGEVLKDYYPAIIRPELFGAAQDALRKRYQSGRRGKHTHLFSTLLADARDGGSLYYRNFPNKPAAIIPVGAKTGRGETWSSFPAATFDACVLLKLKELKPSEIYPANAAGDAVVSLSAKLVAKENELREFQQDIDENPLLVKTLKGTLVRLETERQDLAEQLANAQREAASPPAEAFGELQGIVDAVLKKGNDNLRLRCRAALRRLIDRVTCLFTGKKLVRFAAVRIDFRNTDRHRDYLIETRLRNRHVQNPPPPAVRSFAESGLPRDADLRDPEQAKALEKLISRHAGTKV